MDVTISYLLLFTAVSETLSIQKANERNLNAISFINRFMRNFVFSLSQYNSDQHLLKKFLCEESIEIWLNVSV